MPEEAIEVSSSSSVLSEILAEQRAVFGDLCVYVATAGPVERPKFANQVLAVVAKSSKQFPVGRAGPLRPKSARENKKPKKRKVFTVSAFRASWWAAPSPLFHRYLT